MHRISGAVLLYKAAPGESLKVLPDGRVLIAHPAHPLRVRRTDGRIEQVTPESDPDVWSVYVSALKQLLQPN